MCDKTQRSARYTWLGDYPFLGRGVHLKKHGVYERGDTKSNRPVACQWV